MKWYRRLKKNDCVFEGCDFVRVDVNIEKCTKCKRKRRIEYD